MSGSKNFSGYSLINIIRSRLAITDAYYHHFVKNLFSSRFCVQSTMADQTEKAFLKQPKVFLSSKKSGKARKPGKGGNRFWKSIDLGFKTPKSAIEGRCLRRRRKRKDMAPVSLLVLKMSISMMFRASARNAWHIQFTENSITVTRMLAPEMNWIVSLGRRTSMALG
ncbi:hypothetical protein ZOSMA_16G00120 [Zostera marina]|uniref:Small ribosomal subunit protein uS17 N-terminal domain-containing protein n=1 Tax=Zostera marina TaxID=29655 RepID=A0A0K9PSK1_ZOSMR|nr:hypothetical protein ZOSMA_16G00120 [Zostera marina]